MAYVNVAEWSSDQVTEWLKGLDNVIIPYINSFLNNGVKGQQLLNLRADDLEHLGVYTLGHQELILEAVEHLRNFHYELDRENLQLLALRLSCAARSLYNELSSFEDTNKVETQTMSNVANIISTIKPLVCWLDRSPFSGQTEYIDRKAQILRLSLEMATCALRDRFAERPVAEIRETCFSLAELADKIIQDISDPMLLQPASLDLATLKKRENDLGFFILPSFRNIHQIAEIKFGSPAHTSGKIEEGDEIVQVNYQTVVGWERKKVLSLFQESPPDILLTLKKRPRHTKIYGQIYMKPYRLPSKKRSLPYNRWHDNLPSPRPELLTIPDFEMPLPRTTSGRLTPQLRPTCSSDTDSCSSVSDSDESPPQSLCPRVYPLKPRPVLQRRNTITGAIPFHRAPSISIEQFWRELKIQASYKHSSSGFIQSSTDIDASKETLLRDKSISYGHGLELNSRPTTVIGLERRKSSKKRHENYCQEDKSKEIQSKKKPGVRFEDEIGEPNEISTVQQELNRVYTNSSDNALHVKNEDSLKFIDDNEDEVQDRSNLSRESNKKEENFKVNVKQKLLSFEEKIQNKNIDLKDMLQRPVPKTRTIYNKVESTDIEVKNISSLPTKEELKFRKPPGIPPKLVNLKKPAVPPRNLDRITQLRGRFDKSHSTPAYDTTELSEVSYSSENVPNINQKKIKEGDITLNDFSDDVLTGKMGEILDTINNSIIVYKQKEQENLKCCDKKEHYELFTPRLTKYEDNQQQRFSHNKEQILTNFMAPIPPPRPLYTLNLESSKLKTSFPSQKIEINSVSNLNQTPQKVFSPIQTPKFKLTPDILDTKLKINIQESGESRKHGNKSEKCDIKLPSNPVVKAIISKGKTVKKKNSLLAKRRKVSVKSISPGEIQGYLYQRIRNKTTQNVNWLKRWFVLNGSALYGFRTKDASKADCVIFLAGFTVSLANEVKSRANAFKVYHTGTAFYLSADNVETMSTWVDLITLATLKSDMLSTIKSNESSLYSETDESDVEDKNAKLNDKLETPTKFGSLKKFTSRKHSDASTSSTDSPGSTSLDRKYLRFFNSYSSTKSVKNQNLPVPTAQFRSYRKVVPPLLVVNQNISSRSTGLITNAVKNCVEEKKTPDLLHNIPTTLIEESPQKPLTLTTYKKPKPINYIHASNPSLCDFADFKVPTFVPKLKSLHRNDNLSGFITLEQFMLKRQEEERKQQNGFSTTQHNETDEIDKKSESLQKQHKKLSESHSFPHKSSESQTDKLTICRKYSDGTSDKNSDYSSRLSSQDQSSSFGQNRSLTQTSNSQKISTDSVFDDSSQLQDESDCDLPYEVINDVAAVSNPKFSKVKKGHPPTPKHKNKIVRQHSLNSNDKKIFQCKSVFNRGDSPEKFWLNSLRRNDKVFFSSTPKNKAQLETQYTPTNYSFSNVDPKLAFELNLDEKNHSTKTSKFKSFFSSSKTPSDSHKGKTLLGSPRLHRAIFRRNHSPPTTETDWRGDFSQPSSSLSHLSKPINYSCVHTTPISVTNSVISQSVQTPDYPDLEYPPIFEPETYSLLNPASSLLRKTNKNLNSK